MNFLYSADSINDNSKFTINLTGAAYNFKESIFIKQDVTFTTNQKTPVRFMYASPSTLLQVNAGSTFTFKNINLDLASVNNFITNDTTGCSNHTNFIFSNSNFSNLNGTFFTAAISSVADSIIISNCIFSNNKGKLFSFISETTNKGFYNVEILKMSNN